VISPDEFKVAPDGFMWFMAFWSVLLVLFMAIGGYFMFRKFLKLLPMKDGKSKLDWENYWVEKSRPLWTDETKELLEKLVSPVPAPFRDTARHAIAAKIGQIAVESGEGRVTVEHCIEGYIKATPRRDHKFLIEFLEKNRIDYSRFKHLLE